MVDGAGPYTVWLENWIRANTDGSSRIFFEVSLPRIYDGGRVTGFLARQTGREFIGGPYPHLHTANFQAGSAFGKALKDFPKERFTAYLDLYNIAWIIAHTIPSQAYIATLPNVEEVARKNEFRIYRVRQVASFFLKGQGKVRNREHNRLVVTDVTGDSIVLKYHFYEKLVIEPQAKMYPVTTELDPIPFIGIDAPPQEFTITIR